MHAGKELDDFLERFFENTPEESDFRTVSQNQLKRKTELKIDEFCKQESVYERKKIRSSFSVRTKAAFVILIVLFPVTLLSGWIIFAERKYLAISLILVIYAMLPFLVAFEGRKHSARELMVIAVLSSLGIAGRAAFFMLPQFKPMAAIVIISGVSMGAESGFLIGALSALVSNFFFGQGPWTPWQMTAFGSIGFMAGFLPAKRKAMCLYGFLSVLIVYGGMMNPASVLMFSGEIKWESILAAYISGVPMDLIHAISTVTFLWVLADPMLEKISRVKKKYGI